MRIRRTMLASLALVLGCAAQGNDDLGGLADPGAGGDGPSSGGDGGVKGGIGSGGPGTGGLDSGGGGGALDAGGGPGTGGGFDSGGGGGALDAGGGPGPGGNVDSGSGGGGVDSGPPVPPPPPGSGPVLPTPVGACPEFKSGTATFSPKSGGTRTVTITMSDAAKTKSGPLIIYWYATGSSPSEAQRGLPISQVTAAGGIVVAPSDVAGAGSFPWLSQLTQHYDLADEIVACAAQKTAFDHSHIHSVGFSAGGLMTTQLSFARSSYLASVAAYSGGTNAGGAAPAFQESSNKFAVMGMTGGSSDNVFGQDFYNGTKAWQSQLKAAGHFAMFCDHGGGHSIPTRLVPGVFQFFLDHPYGRNPSPYAGGKIPGGINPPCME